MVGQTEALALKTSQIAFLLIWDKGRLWRVIGGLRASGAVHGSLICPGHYSKSGNSSLGRTTWMVRGLPGSRVIKPRL